MKNTKKIIYLIQKRNHYIENSKCVEKSIWRLFSTETKKKEAKSLVSYLNDMVKEKYQKALSLEPKTLYFYKEEFRAVKRVTTETFEIV